MRSTAIALALLLVPAAADAAQVGDYFGRWSRGNCAEEWVQFAEGKVTQFSDRFQPVASGQAATPAPAQPAKAAEPAKPAAKPAPNTQPRNPATARKLVDSDESSSPATRRRIINEPKQPTPPKSPNAAAAPAPAAKPAAKPAASSKTMDLPAKYVLDGERLSVETQETGRKPRREVYVMRDKDTLVLQDTYVDGRRIPPITRDQITYTRCK